MTFTDKLFVSAIGVMWYKILKKKYEWAQFKKQQFYLNAEDYSDFLQYRIDKLNERIQEEFDKLNS